MLKTHGSNVELLKTIRNSFRTLKKITFSGYEIGKYFYGYKNMI